MGDQECCKKQTKNEFGLASFIEIGSALKSLTSDAEMVISPSVDLTEDGIKRLRYRVVRCSGKLHRVCLQVATNVSEQKHLVTHEDRGKCLGSRPGFRGCTVWLTGLSGAGKTSIAFELEKRLATQGIPAYALDGDNVRRGLNRDLGFSQNDREENIRRVAEVAKLFADSGMVAICSFVSPFADDRDMARKIHQDADLRFYEVYINTPLSVCEARDVKGLYKKAREGSIQGFTGVTQAYEAPKAPDLIVATEGVSIKVSCEQVIELLVSEEIIPKQVASV